MKKFTAILALALVAFSAFAEDSIVPPTEPIEEALVEVVAAPVEQWLVLLVADEGLADLYSRAFWMYVNGVGKNGTQYLIGWTIHPTSGDVALHLPSQTWHVSEHGSIVPILAVLSEAATPEQKQALAAHLVSLQGTEVGIQDLIPAHFAPLLRNREEMVAQGWFTSAE